MQNKWPADKIERRSVDSLIPYAMNSRTHSDAQVTKIAASMKEWGWTNPILVDEVGGIIAGHGRLMAAKKLGYTEAPCMVAEGWTDAQKKAYVIADNKLALEADWDIDLLKTEFQALDDFGFDLELTGFGVDELSSLFDDGGEAPENDLSENYSRKIEAPIYEITGACPPVSSLRDETKTDELKSKIKEAALPEDVSAFLFAAAERHTVFDFAKIAEFYAHATPSTQRLMEESALVIIDFDQAIESGFVKLAKGMMEQVRGIKQDA